MRLPLDVSRLSLRARKLSRDDVLHAIIRRMAGSVSPGRYWSNDQSSGQATLGSTYLAAATMTTMYDAAASGSGIDVVAVSRALVPE